MRTMNSNPARLITCSECSLETTPQMVPRVDEDKRIQSKRRRRNKVRREPPQGRFPWNPRLARRAAACFHWRLAVAVQQKGRKVVPASLPHSTLRTTLNLFSILRRRFAPVSHTRSDYCVFASSTQTTYQKRCPPHVTSCGDKARAGKNGGKSRFCPVLRLLRLVKNCRY